MLDIFDDWSPNCCAVSPYSQVVVEDLTDISYIACKYRVSGLHEVSYPDVIVKFLTCLMHLLYSLLERVLFS